MSSDTELAEPQTTAAAEAEADAGAAADSMAASDDGRDDPLGSLDEIAHASRLLRARLMAFQRIGAPLLAAVADWRYEDPDTGPVERTAESDAALFARLLESTVTVSRTAAEAMGATIEARHDWARWALAAALADVVTAHFRATGRALSTAETEMIVGAIDRGGAMVEEFQLFDERGREEGIRSLRIRMVDAMAPVVGAIARFSFGRDQHALVMDVANTIQEKAVALTDRLLPDGAPDAQWAALFKGILHAASELYSDCHYAEMDRLLDMTPQERSAYVREHENSVPLDPVWRAFDLRLSMLAEIAEHLELPDGTGAEALT